MSINTYDKDRPMDNFTISQKDGYCWVLGQTPKAPQTITPMVTWVSTVYSPLVVVHVFHPDSYFLVHVPGDYDRGGIAHAISRLEPGWTAEGDFLISPVPSGLDPDQIKGAVMDILDPVLIG